MRLSGIILSAITPATAFVSSTLRHTMALTTPWMSNSDDDVSDFDPLLSPHAYPNGIDNGAVPDESFQVEESSASMSSYGFESIIEYQEMSDASSTRVETISTYEEFDPTLSPHQYPNGIAAGAVEEEIGYNPKQGKLGILLIDHGSKREASNAHLHNLAKVFQYNYNEKNNGEKEKTVVRGAHMEIATPSILTSLRNLISVDQVTRIVCVPYFLSPGRHATTDVPNLINEAKAVLNEEGGNDLVEIIVSDALGTQADSMLDAVDKLVDLALTKNST